MIKKLLRYSILVGFILNSGHAQDAEIDIVVAGLFKNKAVVIVDGKQRILGLGLTSPEGITLVEVTADYVILEYQGEKNRYGLGNARISGRFSEKQTATVNIYRDRDGMYRAVGAINGMPVKFMVDTGASAVAMNAGTAARLGVDYRSGQASGVNTASGTAPAYRVKLNSVAVGEIKLQHVDAFVVEGNYPLEILLGMSFLGRMEINYQGNIMQLTPRY